MEYDEKDGMGDRHKILTDLYYNPEIGYQSKNKLYRKAKPYFLQNGMTLTMKNVDDFIKRQETAQVNKQKTRKTAYNKITSHGVNDIWQADLLDVQKWSKFNQGYRYILTIIDIYSRFAWVIPLKTKTTDEVREALEELLRTYNLTNFTTDNGKEFTGNEVKKLLEKHKVKHWTHEPGNHNTLGVIERFNKTIRMFFTKYFTANKTKTWIDILSKFIQNYNSTYHETIRAIPYEVFTQQQQYNNQQLANPEVQVFNIGDKIRLKKKKKILDKFGETYSKLLYEVVKTGKNSYKIQNEEGNILKRTIKPYEMIKIQEIDIYKIEDKAQQNREKNEIKRQKTKRKLNKEGLTEEVIIPKKQRKTAQIAQDRNFIEFLMENE